MANRSYLYSLSHSPTAYDDRPETISGLSEWPYDIPFSYRVLMSGNPRLCASLISDGLDDEENENKKIKLYAISSHFETGFSRLRKFFSVLSGAAAAKAPQLAADIKNAVEFLEAHRDNCLLLETVELDLMSENEENKLRTCVESEIERCQNAGAAIDALPDSIEEAVIMLKKATGQPNGSALDAFCGLQLNENYDHAHFNYPIGVSYWSDVLYFGLWNRAEFEANR